jgi:hypothetical protein
MVNGDASRVTQYGAHPTKSDGAEDHEMLKSRLQSQYWLRLSPARLVRQATILFKEGRDASVAERPKLVQQERSVTTYFERLFLQSIESQQPKLISVGGPLRRHSRDRPIGWR